VLVSEKVYGLTDNPRLALVGLLHDAAEAYIGDISSPFKEWIRRSSPILVNLEDRIQKEINARFGLNGQGFYDPERVVHNVDRMIYNDECLVLFPNRGELNNSNLLTGATIMPMTPEQARAEFISRYHFWTRRINDNQG
jgi:hypothetical protein